MDTTATTTRLPAAAAALVAMPAAASRLRGVRTRAPRAAATAPLPGWVHPALVRALAETGIEELWSHQLEAAEAARAGRHVVVSTGTASGKTLAYLLPAATAALEGGPDGGARTSPTTLYLSPTKALAADQERRLAELAVPGLRTGTVDGDATSEQRTWVRDHAHLVLSNPDLLAHTLLPDHARWGRLLRRLSYVVVDECHVYRGVFGAHVGAVLRRLRRVAAAYGASPTFVLCSATIAEPARTASRLTGLPVHAVERDGSPDPGATLLLWDPVVDEPVVDEPGVVAEGVVAEGGPVAPRAGARAAASGARPYGAPEAAPGGGPGRARRRGVVAESADLVAELVTRRVTTVAFVPSRRATETVAGRTRDALVSRHGPDVGGRLAQAVVPYRGGHLPEERRATERALREGDLLAVAATSALELGVDVAGLDAVVMAGWPGSVASLRQRAGRAGRGDLPGTAVLIARDDPLDAYVLAHPAQVLDAPVEAVVSDTDNPYVLLPHLAAAAAELPLTEADLPAFGSGARDVVDVLVERGDLRRRPGGWFWARPDRPRVDLRGSGRGQVQLVEDATGRVLGTVEAARAEQVVHPGAVYQHLLRSYVVLELDLEAGVALLRAGDPGWSTYPRTVTRTRLVQTDHERRLGRGRLQHGALDVVSRTTGFVRVDNATGAALGHEDLDLPERSFRTRGTWWAPDADAAAALVADPLRALGALHAAEHAAVALVPLVATCDTFDVAGSHEVHHPDAGGPLLLVHDTWPGGAGYAERVYETAEVWARAALEAVSGCPCLSGCPACVVRGGCGSGNQPLDKSGAVDLLGLAAG
ncbi:DEAD/DEAH box helicase [Aquipuribacter sp. MA13-6]|uniref:DEAD/DEAH box helicase n=1 Tax=unclassified Aquipuribacter TaxID=2635084 RepID=UPI003EEE1090